MNTPTTDSGLFGRSTFLSSAILLATFVLPPAAFAQAPPPPPQPPLDLLSNASFAILAGSKISNIPTSAVTGNIGLSPASGSFITGFGLTEITGTVYTVDATYPTAGVAVIDPARLTAAKGDLTIAYSDAAGRTPVPTGTYLNPGAGNLGGLTLIPGLYKFTGAALLSGSSLTLTGNACDVWIFQIGTSLSVANGIQVILAGGAQAANVFWQVGSSADIGVGSVMQGTILADQSITLATGATLNGRALASIAAVTLDSNSVTKPATPAWSVCVTPSAGLGGSVTPDTPQPVMSGATTSFAAIPNIGYTRNSKVLGTCPQGSWTGNVWTTGAVSTNCTVDFGFFCWICLPGRGSWRATVQP
ncbi:ice-binding family protein [uncultured Thiodictyon sp.]|uniref:ice-binding family protein n=1 Tax=uncultured Thiodictyon sp. TaxID=1846217 RepID=UPI0025CCAAFD|nr:ice-binding family protein [uncultured Thiodictyon sp.]